VNAKPCTGSFGHFFVMCCHQPAKDEGVELAHVAKGSLLVCCESDKTIIQLLRVGLMVFDVLDLVLVHASIVSGWRGGCKGKTLFLDDATYVRA